MVNACGVHPLPFGHKHAVIAVLFLVYHAHPVDVVVIEDEEAVPQEVHLQDRLLGGHRAGGIGLFADDERALLVEFVVIVDIMNGKGAAFDRFFQAGLVLADLSLEALDGAVKGGEEGIAFLLGAKDRASVDNGELHDLHALSCTARDERLGLVAEELVEARELAIDGILEAVADGHLLSGDRDFHGVHPAPAGQPFLYTARRSCPPSYIFYHILLSNKRNLVIFYM